MNSRIVLFIVVALAILVGLFYFLKPKASQQTESQKVETNTVEGEFREISVSGDEFSFTPEEVEISAGEKVRLTFSNRGSSPHNLTVEGLGIQTNTIGPGDTDTIDFVVEEAGTYQIFCGVANHRSQGMEGSLSVQ